MFKDCPYLFKYVYLERKKLPKSKEQVLGTLLHTQFKKIYERAPRFPAIEKILTDFDRTWLESALPELMTDKSEALAYQTDARRLLARFYEHRDRAADVLVLERSFSIPLKDPKTRIIHEITGRIDRIDRLPQGGFRIIDYKTSRTLPAEETIRTNLQLALYHLAVQHLWPTLTKRSALIEVALSFVRHSEMISVKLPASQLARIKKEILTTIREIEASDFPARSSQRCASYPYCLACPYFKDQFRVEKPKIKGEHEVAAVVAAYATAKNEEKQIKQRLAELSALIQDYINNEGLASIFGADVGVSRITFETYEFDPAAVKAILTPLGKWEDVLIIDTKKLSALAAGLAPAIKERLMASRQKTGTRSALRLVKKIMPDA